MTLKLLDERSSVETVWDKGIDKLKMFESVLQRPQNDFI